MPNLIKLRNATTLVETGTIEVERAIYHEKINDKLTLDFECYAQTHTNKLHANTIIECENEYFRIAEIEETPIRNHFSVSCEHVSYELNYLTPEEEEEKTEDLHYEGSYRDIIEEILEDTRFTVLPVDNIPTHFTFKTRSKGKRSRILDFCKEFGLEVHWSKFNVYIQLSRGSDHGLEVELGKNLRDLSVQKRFNFNGTVETSFDVDIIDLNKIKKANGQPIEEDEIHMGDVIYLKYKGTTFARRVMSTKFDIFKRALPTIELENARKSITQIVKDLKNRINDVEFEAANGGGGGGEGEMPVNPQIFGVKIDETNSNPASALIYTDGAIGFTPAFMNFSMDTFNYGTWEDKFPFNEIKPCLFKDGEVVGYLKKSDYSQFEDGSPADITSGNDGDVMIEFPKVWWKFHRADTDLYVRIANYKVDSGYKCLAHKRGENEVDKIYVAAYFGCEVSGKLRSLSGKTPTRSKTINEMRVSARANGANYEQITFYQILLLQILFVIMFKSRNAQSVLGGGVTNTYNVRNTGTTNSKGLFYGKNSQLDQIKFCGIEDVFGNVEQFVEGVITNSEGEFLLSNDGFNNSNIGYIGSGEFIEGEPTGYLLKPKGTTDIGFISKSALGSDNTYYTDYINNVSDKICTFGGYHSNRNSAGMFNLAFYYRNNQAIDYIGGRLSNY